MDAVLGWLDARQREEARTEELRATNPVSVPPASLFVSHFPHLLQNDFSNPNAVVEDIELNPARLFEISMRGVCSIMKQSYFENKQPQDKPFDQFTLKELDAAFSFTSIIVPKTTPTTTGTESPAPPPQQQQQGTKRYSVAPAMPPNNKRARPPVPPQQQQQFMSRNATPAPPAATPVLPEYLASPPAVLPAISEPTPPPLPPPRSKTPPPLPQLAKQPSTTAILKMSGTIKLLPTTAKGDDDDDDDDDDSVSSDRDISSSNTGAVDGSAGQPSVLKLELLRTVDNLIKITNWPKQTRSLVYSYKSKGYPEGNPFAVVLKRGCGYVPETYFDFIERPLDLTTIKDRVQHDFYLTLAMFESDVQLVVSNAVRYNFKPDTLKAMAEHLQIQANKELANAKHRLTRASLQT